MQQRKANAHQNTLMRLRKWRDEVARQKGLPDYLVLPNTTVNEIAMNLPETKEELLAIKGIKEGKWNEYGKTLLALVRGEDIAQYQMPLTGNDSLFLENSSVQNPPEAGLQDALSVSSYLDRINILLKQASRARVVGEITSFKIQGKAVYFGVKDKDDDSVLNAFMWLSDYNLCGVDAEIGLEVIIEGVGDIYKPLGRFSFRAETIELVGEGALKKAYMELKKKLTEEGVFAESIKRPLPDFPERIGLITSKTGAVIHDFLNNLGKFGFKVNFIDSRVEGVAAIRDILAALATMRTQKIDVLVLVRGGGSLESLQAFNNERIVRAIREFPVPVICAIGHDQDVPLAQLAADAAPSTPTATTMLINRSWEHALKNYQLVWAQLCEYMQQALFSSRNNLHVAESNIREYFIAMLRVVDEFNERLLVYVERMQNKIFQLNREIDHMCSQQMLIYETILKGTFDEIGKMERILRQSDPKRLLDLGYALVKQGNQYCSSVERVEIGAQFTVELKDGTIDATVTHKNTYDRKSTKT